MLPSILEAVCCCEGWIGVWRSDPADFVVNCIEDNEGQGDYENEDTTILGMSQEINLSEVKNNENVDEDGTDDESDCADLKLRCWCCQKY